ncbi:MAG: aminopeptidase N [Proteobacteria bacterium]|nr:aminopeptidase N [Pseudomonadota bacterium]
MRTETAPVIRLSDYQPPDFLVSHVDMLVSLHATETRIRTTLTMQRNPSGFAGTPVVLEGDDLVLEGLMLDGEPLAADRYTAAPDKLVLPNPPEGTFTLAIDTLVNPTANTKLMGLFRSNGVYCTQCEAEGFRRITYFPDRPDVMSVYRVTIEADRDEAPVLLSNGNPGEFGTMPDSNRHFVVWEDPFPKPCYLFALVGGDLDAISDTYTTGSGQAVDLNIFVEKGKGERARYAMDSLIRSMRWDEDTFGREYDLGVFNIVAVSDFNMGAMENKGLNVFNDRYILASPETATDQDYHNIEAIVAHEYFHNWTGNRITCRDWFQLCLKEGLTVFRDQEFSSDMRSRPVERINAVKTLRATQFVEDAGPLAHPVRPSAYREISNFYTATVYNKGAEVIRMLKVLIGAANFRKGMDLYFARHDGEAATIEEFIACFAEAANRDLSQFMRWYNQAGTPRVKVTQVYDPVAGTLKVDFEQTVPPTPGQPDKLPAVIPVTMGIIGETGKELATSQVLVLQSDKGTKTFSGITERPILSLLRGFSAPVRLEANLSEDDLLTLARHDVDSFNRWESVQAAGISVLRRSVASVRDGGAPLTSEGLAAAVRALLEGGMADPAFAALAVTLPGDADLFREIGHDIDPDAVFAAVDTLFTDVGRSVLPVARDLYARLSVPRPFSADAESAGLRALRGAALSWIGWADQRTASDLAYEQFRSAETMTDKLSALGVLNRVGGAARESAFQSFERDYGHEPLILDSWFTYQALLRTPDALDRVKKLMQHPGFSATNPNRVRALIGAFAHSNIRQFHRADGEGYRFVADFIRSLDAANPQVAARLATAFRTYQTLEPTRRALARQALASIIADGQRSRDVTDIVERALAG